MKLTKHINWRVVVDVPRHRWVDTKGTLENHERLMREAAKEIADNIKRHIDTDEQPRIEADEVCRFCEYLWASAIDEEGKPGCCDKALSEWQAAHPDSQQFGVGA